MVAITEGTISEATYWQCVLERTHWPITAQELHAGVRHVFRQPMPGMPELVLSLRRHRLVLFSDQAREWWEDIAGTHAFLRVFEQRFLSFAMGQTKRHVERTFAWLGRCRRHRKDYERRTDSSEAMLRVSAIHRMLKRLKPSDVLEGQARGALTLFQEVVNLAPYLPAEVGSAAANLSEPGLLADFIAAHLNLRLEERQGVLDTVDVAERLRKVTELLQREKEILEIGRKAQQERSKTQRDYVLRQQMEAIRRELGDADERQEEVNALRERLAQAQLPEEARKEAERELERLAHMPPGAAEYIVARTYLDWLLDLP